MLIEINYRPSDRQLRQFGAICAVALPAIGWLWGAAWWVVAWLAVIGIGLAVIGWVRPQLLRPVFVGLSLVTLPIGMVLGELAMLLIFYGIFLPIGLAMRLLGRDALRLRRERNSTSYWQVKKKPRGPASYYRQS